MELGHGDAVAARCTEPAEMGSVRGRRCRAAADCPDRDAAGAARRAAFGLGLRQGYRLVHAAGAGTLSGPRRHLARLPTLRAEGDGHWSRRDLHPWLLGLV